MYPARYNLYIWSLGNVRAASQRVCELQVYEFASWKFASHIIWKKE